MIGNYSAWALGIALMLPIPALARDRDGDRHDSGGRGERGGRSEQRDRHDHGDRHHDHRRATRVVYESRSYHPPAVVHRRAPVAVPWCPPPVVYHAPAYRPPVVYTCPPPVVYHAPPPVIVCPPERRPRFTFDFGIVFGR